jgi:hypothetical protein
LFRALGAHEEGGADDHTGGQLSNGACWSHLLTAALHRKHMFLVNSCQLLGRASAARRSEGCHLVLSVGLRPARKRGGIHLCAYFSVFRAFLGTEHFLLASELVSLVRMGKRNFACSPLTQSSLLWKSYLVTPGSPSCPPSSLCSLFTVLQFVANTLKNIDFNHQNLRHPH